MFKSHRCGQFARTQAIHLPLSAGESAAIGLVMMAVVMVPLLSVPAEHFWRMTHEGAHALLAVILGLAVTEIVLDRHSEGRTGVVGEGLRVVLVVLIGYLGPSLFGLGAARLISFGHPVAVLWLLVVLLVLVLCLLSRSFGPVPIAIAIALLYGILHYSHTRTEVVAAYAVTWLLLLSGLRAAISHGIHSAEAESLRRPHASASAPVDAPVGGGRAARAARRRETPHPGLVLQQQSVTLLGVAS